MTRCGLEQVNSKTWPKCGTNTKHFSLAYARCIKCYIYIFQLTGKLQRSYKSTSNDVFQCNSNPLITDNILH